MEEGLMDANPPFDSPLGKGGQRGVDFLGIAPSARLRDRGGQVRDLFLPPPFLFWLYSYCKVTDNNLRDR